MPFAASWKMEMLHHPWILEVAMPGGFNAPAEVFRDAVRWRLAARTTH
jgi:hypothetical protein